MAAYLHRLDWAQLDIVVTSADDRSGIVGSCKFRNELVDVDELDLICEYADAMGGFDRRYYYLFSKAGFTEALRAREKDGQVRLIQLEEMYGDSHEP